MRESSTIEVVSQKSTATKAAKLIECEKQVINLSGLAISAISQKVVEFDTTRLNDGASQILFR